MRVFCVWLLGTAVLTFPGCEEKIKPAVLPAVDSSILPSQESWKSDIIISDSGKVKALINAGYLRTFDDKRTTFLTEGVVVYFFDEQGRQSSVLTSEEAKVDEYTNNLEALRNVVVTSNDQTTLKTEKLFWDNRRALIHSPEFVRIANPKERLQGHGFESEQNLKNYRIFRVTGQAKTD